MNEGGLDVGRLLFDSKIQRQRLDFYRDDDYRLTVCLNNAENSSNVFEKWFSGSVIPDSKNPRP